MMLTDGQLLYHGSYTEVRKIDLARCKAGLDFGKGFYATADQEQAMRFVPRAVRKAVRLGVVRADFPPEEGAVSVYRYHADPQLLVHEFPQADLDWLHFVAANRDQTVFPALLRKFETVDIVCGKIADDQTARTLQAYLAGAYGTPGTPQADREAIRTLLPNRLSDQLCFRTADAVAALEFVRSVRYAER